jgi:hypothetical protein
MLSTLSVCFKSHGPHPEAPFAKAEGLEGCSRGRSRRRPRPLIVLRGPFGAPQDEGGGLLKETVRSLSNVTLGKIGKPGRLDTAT